MTSNHKLTGVLKGRRITSTANAGGVMTLGFNDGSVMTVQTVAGVGHSAASGGTIEKVRQQDTTLALDMEDGPTLEITMAEATSSVMVRDKNHALEYVD